MDSDAVAALQDVVDHATPLGHDGDGFVTTGYLVSVGAIHRALGVLAGATHRARKEAIAALSDVERREMTERHAAELKVSIDAFVADIRRECIANLKRLHLPTPQED